MRSPSYVTPVILLPTVNHHQSFCVTFWKFSMHIKKEKLNRIVVKDKNCLVQILALLLTSYVKLRQVTCHMGLIKLSPCFTG